MIHEFKNPIPVVTKTHGLGYAIYVRDGSTFENDIWCVALCNGGIIRHYTTDQIYMHSNLTFTITKNEANSS
jgi:hypothetical protein